MPTPARHPAHGRHVTLPAGFDPHDETVAAAQERVQLWLHQGWQPSAVAAATGLSERVVWHLRRDVVRQRPLTAHVVHAVLAAPAFPPRGRIRAFGVRRRLQALAWMGWSIPKIAALSQVSAATLQLLRAGRCTYTDASVVTAVQTVYRDLAQRTGSSDRSRHLARAAGWASPVAWDGDRIDDPTPLDRQEWRSHVLRRVPRAAGDDRQRQPRPRVDDDVLVDIARLRSAGVSDSGIALRLGRTTGGVQRLRTRRSTGRS